jgi:hypothetical protein
MPRRQRLVHEGVARVPVKVDYGAILDPVLAIGARRGFRLLAGAGRQKDE